jgi:hypothetical protein
MPWAVIMGGAAKFSLWHPLSSSQPSIMSAQFFLHSFWK